jgi:hypothetical protein
VRVGRRIFAKAKKSQPWWRKKPTKAKIEAAKKPTKAKESQWKPRYFQSRRGVWRRAAAGRAGGTFGWALHETQNPRA